MENSRILAKIPRGCTVIAQYLGKLPNLGFQKTHEDSRNHSFSSGSRLANLNLTLTQPKPIMSLDTASLQEFDIRPLHAPLGAEVLGLDLTRPISTAALARVHRAHLDHHVLVFRDARITPAQQVEFSRRFGELQIHVLRQFRLAGTPEVLVISNIRENGEPIGLGDAGHYWHSDLSYKATPSLGLDVQSLAGDRAAAAGLAVVRAR